MAADQHRRISRHAHRIVAECERTGEPAPASPAALVRCVLDSLALAYRRTLIEARGLAGRDIDVVHLVGGGHTTNCSPN